MITYSTYLFFNTTVNLSKNGGARTHTIEKISAFANTITSNISLLCWEKDEKKYPFKIYEYPFNFKVNFYNQVLFELYSTIVLLKLSLYKRDKICFLRYRPLCFITLLFAKIFGWKIVFEPNDNVVKQLKIQNNYSGMKRSVVDFCLSTCFNFSNIILCHSKIISEWAKSYLNTNKESMKVIIASMGANPNIFNPMDINNSKNKLGFQSNDCILVDIGTLTEWSGAISLIDVMSNLKKFSTKQRFFLILVGKGNKYYDLNNEIKKRDLENHVLLKNGVPYEKIPDYINAADICFCLKDVFLDVTSPNRLYEYLFCQKKIIMTQSYEGHFSKFNSIVYVDPKKVNQIINIITNQNSFFDDNDVKKDRKKALEKYSWNSVVKEIFEKIQ